jgi:hypothetical protein
MLKGVPDEDLPRVAHVEKGEPRFAAWVAVRDEEERRPVLAYRRVGLGTSAALLVDPEAEPELRTHPELPRLLGQLARSVLPDVEAALLAVEHRVVETAGERRLEIRVLGEDGLPRTDLPVEADGLETTRRADRYEAVLPPDDRPRTVTVRVGSLLERSFVVPPAASAERAATGADHALLVRLAGDPLLVDRPAAESLDRPTEQVPFRRPLPLPFLLLAAILLPLDAWARRRLLSGSR